MSRKLMISTVLAMVMVLMVGVAVYAHGPGPVNSQAGAAAGEPAAFQGQMGGGQQMLQLHDGTNGTCDDFVDEDGDGVCDNAPLDGTGAGIGAMTRQGFRANNQAAAGMRGQGGQGLGAAFVDADGDGVCDNFLDEDGDGISDIAPRDRSGSQFGQGRGSRGHGRNR